MFSFIINTNYTNYIPFYALKIVSNMEKKSVFPCHIWLATQIEIYQSKIRKANN